MPASPRMTSASLAPARTLARSPSSKSRSMLRPTNPGLRVATIGEPQPVRRPFSALLPQGGSKGVARVYSQLREHFIQMPFNGARTQEQLGADLRVREAVASQPRDLLLL